MNETPPSSAHAKQPGGHRHSIKGSGLQERADDRLKGWKEIGEYLKVSGRTAQRWEGTLDLPVRRVETSRSAVVFASRQELDAWESSGQGKKARMGLDGA
ncbi:MAG: hypothetical protein EHM65_02350, partial [Acidobacteriales bacterium]